MGQLGMYLSGARQGISMDGIIRLRTKSLFEIIEGKERLTHGLASVLALASTDEDSYPRLSHCQVNYNAFTNSIARDKARREEIRGHVLVRAEQG